MIIIPDQDAPAYLKCVLGILAEKVHYAVADKDHCMKLVEDDTGNNPNTLASVFITDLPPYAIALNADNLHYSILEQSKREGIWRNIASYRHVSDYIILAEVDGKMCHLYIEMKTGYKTNAFIPQLRCARGQLEHLVYLINKFDHEVMPTEIVHRFVKFSKLPALKMPTTWQSTGFLPEPPVINDEPDRTYQCFVENGARVSFPSLLLGMA